MSVADPATITKTLQQWADEKRLGEATLSSDGQEIRLDDSFPVLASSTVISVEHAGKACAYSLASIFLQIVNPNQSLLAYRTACKKYGIKDSVKAIDKPVVVGAFLGSSTVAETTAVTDAPTAADNTSSTAGKETTDIPTQEKGEKNDVEVGGAASAKDRKRKHRKESSSSSQQHHSSSSSKRHHKDKHDKSSSAAAAKKKKPKEMVTNEEVFEHLNVVVDKRKMEQDADTEEITKALSTEGFEVTAETLAKYRDVTETIVSNEIPVGNSASILRVSNPKKNLSRVLELYLETINPAKDGKHGGSKKPGASGSSSRLASSPTRKEAKPYLVGKKPVIIVPKGMTAPITLVNAHEFLSNAKYIPRDVLMKQGRHRSPPTTFTRTVRSSTGSGSALLEYEIVDNPRKLGSDPREWERVVAVLVLGQGWQFKDWMKGYNTPVELFHRCYGFFISMEGDKLPAEVGTWAVKQMKLNRDKRGLDSVTSAAFWNGLDEWMTVRKPELLPQTEN